MVLGIPFLWISLYAARQVVSLRAAWPAGNPVRRRLVLIQGCIGVHAFVRSLTLLLAFATTSTGQLEDMREFVLGDLPGISYAALMVVLLGDHLTACAKRERRLGLASCCAPPGVALERLRLFGLLVSFLAGTGWVVAAVFLSSTLTAAAIATIDLARDVLFSTLFATASLLGFVAAGRVRASLLDSTAVSSLGAGRTVLAALSLTTAACFAARAAIVVAMDLAFGPRRSQALLLPHSTSSVVAVTVAYYAVSELACSAAWAYAMRCRLFTEEHHLLLERALLPSDFELDPAEVKDFSFLGAGGFGDVYQARYRDTPVAVKVFRAPAMSPVSSPIAPAAAAAGSDGDPLLLPASRGAGPASEGDSALWRAGLLDRAPLGRGGPDKPPTGYGAAASLVEEGSGRGSTAAAIAFPPHPTLHALHHARTRQRFVREVQLLCALRHPRIVQLFGYTFLDDRSLPPAQRSASAPARDTAWATAGGVCSVALVMEFVGKGSLYNLLHRSDHPLSPRQRLLLALDVAEGMSFLHASGVLHRDLKSANILVDRSFGAKLCDFGLARESVVVRVATRHGREAASAISHATRTASAAGPSEWTRSASRLHGELGALGMRAPHPNAAIVGPAAVHPHEPGPPHAAGDPAAEAPREAAARGSRAQDAGSSAPNGSAAAAADAEGGNAPAQRSLPPLTGAGDGDCDGGGAFEVPPAPPSAVGTLAWTAPEVLCGRLSSTHADVFSFGVLLWELMSRQVPWQGYDAVAVVHEVVERDARPPLPHSCPPDVADLIRACWLREPEARPPFSRVARHLAVLLDSAVGGV